MTIPTGRHMESSRDPRELMTVQSVVNGQEPIELMTVQSVVIDQEPTELLTDQNVATRREPGAERQAMTIPAGDARVTLTEKTQRAQMEWRQGRAGQMRLREQLKEPSLAGWQRRKIELKLKLGADGWEPEKKIATSSMEKIRLLNSEFPKEWTIKHLSEQFKISQESVRRILKSKFQSSEEHTEQREHQRKLKIRAFKRSEKGGSK
ncbi:Required for respiratory growth protein 9 mitochondrial [Coemansia sp. RSA 521]|nr:Required for respiratory growth protein 9 mitochondrial [Coemansia sp. RSA 521]